MGIITSTRESNQEKPKETSFLSKFVTTIKGKEKKESRSTTPKVYRDKKLLIQLSQFETKYPNILHQYIVQYHLARTFKFPKKKRHQLLPINISISQDDLNNSKVSNNFPSSINQKENENISPNRYLEGEIIDPTKKISIAQEGSENLAEYQIVKEEFIQEFIEFEKEYSKDMRDIAKLNIFDLLEEFTKRIENKSSER